DLRTSCGAFRIARQAGGGQPDAGRGADLPGRRQALDLPASEPRGRFLPRDSDLPPGVSEADGADRFCPAPEDIRGWEALESLTEHTSKATLDIIAPKSARRRAASRRAEWLQDAKDTRIFTRVSAWDVPPSWWLFFSLSEDQIITDETEAGLRVLIRTDILAASARMEWAAETISDTSKVVDMVEQTSDLVEWIDSFDMNSILELDLGGMSDVLWPTEAPELVDS